MGRRLTVVTRSEGVTSVLGWDLAEIGRSRKWIPTATVHSDDRSLLKGTILEKSHPDPSGTVVLISDLDKLRIAARTLTEIEKAKANLIGTVTDHLRLVFHRFLEKSRVRITLGSINLGPWNPFSRDGEVEESSWKKSEELLDRGQVRVRTFVLPHHKNLSSAEHDRLGGPLGWNAHQGFLIYRADRLIMPGGWLGFSKPEEHCKLARVCVDLPNTVDEQWGLDVVKSKVTPPVTIMADMERIATAARSEAKKRYGFHAELEAPLQGRAEQQEKFAFWSQQEQSGSIRFRINRGHPLVEALKQELLEPRHADAFLQTFERLLPVSAILQQQARATHGLSEPPDVAELEQLVQALIIVRGYLSSIGMTSSEASEAALSCQPFSKYRTVLLEELDKLEASQHD
jgi:hypothetical protein